MSVADIRNITVDRISNNDNPIAREKYKAREIIVYGAKPGQTVEVVIATHYSTPIGLIIDPTSEQKRHMKQQAKESNIWSFEIPREGKGRGRGQRRKRRRMKRKDIELLNEAKKKKKKRSKKHYAPSVIKIRPRKTGPRKND